MLKGIRNDILLKDKINAIDLDWLALACQVIVLSERSHGGEKLGLMLHCGVNHGLVTLQIVGKYGGLLYCCGLVELSAVYFALTPV